MRWHKLFIPHRAADPGTLLLATGGYVHRGFGTRRRSIKPHLRLAASCVVHHFVAEDAEVPRLAGNSARLRDGAGDGRWPAEPPAPTTDLSGDTLLPWLVRVVCNLDQTTHLETV